MQFFDTTSHCIYYKFMVQKENMESAYKLLRKIIFLIPAAAVAVTAYLILFPVENFSYFSDRADLSKFEPEISREENSLSFGVFPTQKNRLVELDMAFERTDNPSCFSRKPEVLVKKTYRAFLFPEGDPIAAPSELRDALFFENKTRFPNGSLLHLKPTDEVYLISDGKKILFPGPEIFRAFGYDFANLVDVDKSALDQFPDADKKVFLWTQPHPNGTIFQGYPSHTLYLVLDGKRRRVEGPDLFKSVWPDFFSIAAQDAEVQKDFVCADKGGDFSSRETKCGFDSAAMPESIGKYFHFVVKFPADCDVTNVAVQKAEISFIAEKSYATAKDSLRIIFASILNRYIGKKQI